jgi:hypothetical protein
MADGPVQFANSKEMLRLLDVAAQKGVVCSTDFLNALYGSQAK